MLSGLKIGQVAKKTGITAKALRFYERLELLPAPGRSQSGYRLYSEEHLQRVGFIKKAKHLGLSLDEIKGILDLGEQRQIPCVHVLALMDQKLAQVDAVIKDLRQFRRELAQLGEESKARLAELPEESQVCGIIERGIHARGELALAWLEKGRRGG
jgi:DNA-binding transcriptional MerR regulator